MKAAQRSLEDLVEFYSELSGEDSCEVVPQQLVDSLQNALKSIEEWEATNKRTTQTRRLLKLLTLPQVTINERSLESIENYYKEVKSVDIDLEYLLACAAPPDTEEDEEEVVAAATIAREIPVQDGGFFAQFEDLRRQEIVQEALRQARARGQ